MNISGIQEYQSMQCIREPLKPIPDRKTDRFTGGLKGIFIDKTLKSPEISAEALYYLGVSKEMEGVSGKFFNLTTEEEPAPPALDKEASI
ncbi:MAG: hypothetical protein MZW92_61685 [Comamonadaceae bacterium]|nr:hypothetical protein [Comamonadaceae bacterium]